MSRWGIALYVLAVVANAMAAGAWFERGRWGTFAIWMIATAVWSTCVLIAHNPWRRNE